MSPFYLRQNVWLVYFFLSVHIAKGEPLIPKEYVIYLYVFTFDISDRFDVDIVAQFSPATPAQQLIECLNKIIHRPRSEHNLNFCVFRFFFK